MKTKFASFCNLDVCKGCKLCVEGKKLVLFIGGKCARNCWYCSLSESRSKSNEAYANERKINNLKDLIIEAKKSNAKGAGITGGDPLVYFDKVLNYSKSLKKKFGRRFHIHIYLPLHLVNKRKLRKLKKNVDEVRFHPSFLMGNQEKISEVEINKIIDATKIFGKENTGIEIPIIPGKEKVTYSLIKSLNGKIGFVNLNELEISEKNLIKTTSRFSINNDTHTVSGSLSAGKKIINLATKDSLEIKVHLCTARTKDSYQYVNRLKNYNILKFGNRMKDGNVVYFAIYPEKMKEDLTKLKKITKNFYIDKQNNRIIVKMNDVLKVYENSNLKIARILERPTSDQERLEYSVIGE